MKKYIEAEVVQRKLQFLLDSYAKDYMKAESEGRHDDREACYSEMGAIAAAAFSLGVSVRDEAGILNRN